MPAHKKVDRAEFARLHRRGLTQKELAERFGIARSNVIAINSELGLRRRKRPPRISSAERATIERLHNAGLTAPEIAEELGRAASDIRRVRKQMGLKFARRMTTERRERIETMLNDGWSWLEIERTEGASWETMNRHFPGTQWTLQQVHAHRVDIKHALNGPDWRQHPKKAA